MKHPTILGAFGLVVAASLAMPNAFAQTTLRLACPSAPTNPTCMTAQYFADETERLTDGSVTVDVFPSAQLGRGAEAINQTSAGIIDLVVEDISNYSNFVDDYNVVSWGFAFRDADHFNSFLDSDLHAGMADRLEEEFGITLLANNWRKLPRVVVSTSPVFTPEDVEGLVFRVPGIPSYIATWSAIGANPSQVPWGEAFQALRTGVVDAMEAPLDSVASQNFHQAAPYVTLTNHVFSAIALGINSNRLAALSEAEQAAMHEAAQLATQYSIQLAEESRASVVDQIVRDGAAVVIVSSTPFQERLSGAAAEQEAEGLWREGLLREIQGID
ncbi:MAG: TRAP transporter substrate-binding protein [Pseudomonadota bacterium]